MRSLWNCLNDPILHFLGIGLLLVYLTFGGLPSSRQASAESPLAFCENCRLHHLPEKPCDCSLLGKIAQAAR